MMDQLQTLAETRPDEKVRYVCSFAIRLPIAYFSRPSLFLSGLVACPLYPIISLRKIFPTSSTFLAMLHAVRQGFCGFSFVGIKEI